MQYITTGDRPMPPNSFPRYPLLAAPLLVGLALVGSHADAQATTEPVYSSQADAQAASERGYHALLTVPLEAPLVTEQLYFDLWQYWPEPERSKAAAATPDQRRQMMLERYGFQESPDRPGHVPQQFTSDGKGNLSANCLACHGGSVAGKVVRGLGNSLVDFATFNEDLRNLYAAKGIKPPPPPKSVVYPPPQEPVRGVNNAWGMAFAYLLVRDNDLNFVDSPQYATPTADQFDIPMKTPPYWLSKKKSRFYADGFIAKTHRDVMQFTMGYSMPRETILANEETFKDIYTWINAVESPKYPYPIDQALARHGGIVFASNCAKCHGTYGAGAHYPERVVALSEVGTDPVRARDFPVAFIKHLDESWVGQYGKTPIYPGVNGYIAPPLDGIWANAPYLHNGSVPTIWDLLTPASRPSVWTRTDAGYDQQKLGVEAKSFDKLPDDATARVQKRRYYQTNVRGFSNQGHLYPPQGLSDDNKRALIEYLKTL
jgi:mono/diheme cytochrome c family protein